MGRARARPRSPPCGVSESSVRKALRPAGAGGRAGRGADEGAAPPAGAAADPAAGLLVLPDPVPRNAERALARWELLSEGAKPGSRPAPATRWPGCCWRCPRGGQRAAGLRAGHYGQLRNGFYGLTATLLTLVFLAPLREPRAEGATRIPPAALGRVLGLDRAPEVKTIRRKLAELARAGQADQLIMALARHDAAARPEALGFLYADGHSRAYYGTRTVQKTHVARLKFPAPATPETWVTDSGGDPVFMVVTEPSQSLAGELRALLPQLRQVVGEDRRVTVYSDRGGWSPALFADILDAGFDLLTYRKAPVAGLPPRRSPKSPAPTTAAASTSTPSPTRPSPWRSPRARARASRSACGRSPAVSRLRRRHPAGAYPHLPP